ncbi:competence protein ComGD [Mesobacillus persicus]|uniref:Competence protein ComGD n=1 Tax=Mesobacillus persicus TaxID=930146 RepID=A0A1H7X2N7_9BACI|nr:competence type IV pilus minor pilin ComGD [Mesobacillus persicus]SEM28023.1 competence protein ComGD [Mesobacillus persicus]
MDSQKNGFTLIETLIVLSAFLVMSLASSMLLKPTYNLLDSHLFFSQLKSDLFLAQQHAISHQEEVTIHIMPESNYYYIRTRFNGPMLVERKYSPNVKVREGTLNLYFQFLPDGNTNRFGSFYIEIGNKLYRMTVLIGRGRFYVVEE